MQDIVPRLEKVIRRCRRREDVSWPGVPEALVPLTGHCWAEVPLSCEASERVLAEPQASNSTSSTPLHKRTAIEIQGSPILQLLALAPPKGRLRTTTRSLASSSHLADYEDSRTLVPNNGVDPLISLSANTQQAGGPRVLVQYVTLEDAWSYTMSCIALRRPPNVSYVTLTDVASLGAAVALGSHASSPLPLRALRRSSRRVADEVRRVLDGACGTVRAALPVQLSIERKSALRWNLSCGWRPARQAPGETLERDLAAVA